jgi:hypothetical protein
VRRHWLNKQPEIAYTSASLLLALIAYLSTGVFLHLSYVRYYWLIVAMGSAAVQIFMVPRETKQGADEKDAPDVTVLSAPLNHAQN